VIDLTDTILAALRAALDDGLTIGGTATPVTRLPEVPPLATETDDAQYPLICLEVGGSSRDVSWGAGKSAWRRTSFTMHFVAHRTNVVAHASIHSPYEYARKGAAAIDAVLDALGGGWGVTGVTLADWEASDYNAGASDPEQGLWVWSTTWSVVYDAGTNR
jgi:hypothetical protein